MAEAGTDAGGLQRTLKDLTGGAAGGIAQVLLGTLYLNVSPIYWPFLIGKKVRQVGIGFRSN